MRKMLVDLGSDGLLRIFSYKYNYLLYNSFFYRCVICVLGNNRTSINQHSLSCMFIAPKHDLKEIFQNIFKFQLLFIIIISFISKNSLLQINLALKLHLKITKYCLKLDL